MKVVSRPSPEIMFLCNIERIADGLDQGMRDLWCLNGSLPLLERHCDDAKD